MAEKNTTITILVSAAVFLILAVALISSIVSETQNKTTLIGVTNESLDVSSARLLTAGEENDINESTNFTLTHANTGWKIDPSECVITLDNLMFNVSTAAALTTDYIVSDDGIVTLVNSTGWKANPLNASYVSYDYCPDEYLNSSWGRTILNLTPGFIALAILIIAVLTAYQLLRKEED